MNRYVELEEMLLFRERKARIQEELRGKYKGLVTMTLAMNIPGPLKLPMIFCLLLRREPGG